MWNCLVFVFEELIRLYGGGERNWRLGAGDMRQSFVRLRGDQPLRACFFFLLSSLVVFVVVAVI